LLVELVGAVSSEVVEVPVGIVQMLQEKILVAERRQSLQ
jgi:hypothetical protein